MATKRRTEHESQRQQSRPEAAVEAAPPEGPVSRGKRGSGPHDETGAAGSEPSGHPETKGAGEGGQVKDTGHVAGSAPAAVDDCDRRVEELVSQLEEANGRRLRLAADFDNFKKRSRQEQVDTVRFAAVPVVERLLPVLDDANLALSHAPEGVDESWLKGVRLTFQKLEEVISAVGVERVPAVGDRFDPKLHEAVGSVETADQPEDSVVAELRPGYRMHDRVLRPALVRVARPPA